MWRRVFSDQGAMALVVGWGMVLAQAQGISEELSQGMAPMAGVYFSGRERMDQGEAGKRVLSVFGGEAGQTFVDGAFGKLMQSWGLDEEKGKALWHRMQGRECHFGLYGNKGETSAWMVGIHGEDGIVGEWVSAWQQIITEAHQVKAQPVVEGGAEGWMVSRCEGGFSHWAFREGEWFFGGGEIGSISTDLVSRVKARAQDLTSRLRLNCEDWVKVEVDLKLWDKRFLGVDWGQHRPVVKALWKEDGARVRTLLEFEFEEDLELERDAWKVPKGIIRDPIIGFTALRGFRGLLKGQAWWKALGVETAPNQGYAWADGRYPLIYTLIFPFSGVRDLLTHHGPGWAEAVGTAMEGKQIGRLEWVAAREALAWRGIPLLMPHINVEKEGDDEFLKVGLFPFQAGEQPAPDALFEEFEGDDSVVYYDWEMTEKRMFQWLKAFQVSSLIAQDAVFQKDGLAVPWFIAIGPQLGNSATQIRQVGPRRLEGTRVSSMGMTSMELAFLGRWVDQKDFPGLVKFPFLPIKGDHGKPGQTPLPLPGGNGLK